MAKREDSLEAAADRLADAETKVCESIVGGEFVSDAVCSLLYELSDAVEVDTELLTKLLGQFGEGFEATGKLLDELKKVLALLEAKVEDLKFTDELKKARPRAVRKDVIPKRILDG